MNASSPRLVSFHVGTEKLSVKINNTLLDLNLYVYHELIGSHLTCFLRDLSLTYWS